MGILYSIMDGSLCLTLLWVLQMTLLTFAKTALRKLQNLQSKNPDRWNIQFMHTSLECAMHNLQQGARIKAATMYLKWKGDHRLAEKVGSVS